MNTLGLDPLIRLVAADEDAAPIHPLPQGGEGRTDDARTARFGIQNDNMSCGLRHGGRSAACDSLLSALGSAPPGAILHLADPILPQEMARHAVLVELFEAARQAEIEMTAHVLRADERWPQRNLSISSPLAAPAKGVSTDEARWRAEGRRKKNFCTIEAWMCMKEKGKIQGDR